MNRLTAFYNDLLLFHLNEKVIISQECLAEIARHFMDIQNDIYDKQDTLKAKMNFCVKALTLTDRFMDT